nr:MAG TPA: hypothetical protein [Caudoviricetes sp.]
MVKDIYFFIMCIIRQNNSNVKIKIYRKINVL